MLSPSGDYSGQHWVLETLPNGNPGSQDPLYDKYVTMSTQFRGHDIVLSTAQVAPVLWLRRKHDPRSPFDWPRKSQYWLFTAVPGQPDTFLISNGWYREVYLAASPGRNDLTIVSRLDRRDPAVQWRVEWIGLR